MSTIVYLCIIAAIMILMFAINQHMVNDDQGD
jgi:hypothetical protein